MLQLECAHPEEGLGAKKMPEMKGQSSSSYELDWKPRFSRLAFAYCLKIRGEDASESE
jgi:hypothetical protein